MHLNEWFEKGIPAEQFLAQMNTHKENVETIYNSYELPKQDQEFFDALQEKNLKVIVITEDWCGDAMLNIPILLHLAEKTNMPVRMIPRDENLELMDQYLTNGTARSIPIFIFVDQYGKEYTHWGPRAHEVQQLVLELRSALPPKDDETFEEKQKEVFSRMIQAFLTKTVLRDYVYQSLKTALS